MIKALTALIDMVGAVIDFAVKIVTGTIQLLQLIPDILNTFNDALSFLPPLLVAFATVTVTVSSIFIILGRNGGGDG